LILEVVEKRGWWVGESIERGRGVVRERDVGPEGAKEFGV